MEDLELIKQLSEGNHLEPEELKACENVLNSLKHSLELRK